MEFQEENISKMKMDILLFGNIFKRYIANVNQADAQMLNILFELIGDIDGFIQHQHSFPTVHELEIDMRLVKCSTNLSCTACLLTFGTTYQSYTKHMRACKPAKNIKVDPAPTNVLARKAPKIVVIPKISQSEMVLPSRLHIPRERSNSTASNTTTNSASSTTKRTPRQKKQEQKNSDKLSSKSGSSATSINSSKPPSKTSSAVATDHILIKDKPSQANVHTRIFNSNTNTATTANTLSNSVLRRNSDSQPYLPAPQPKPQTRARNPFKIPSPESVLGFQEPLKNSIDSIEKTPSETSISLSVSHEIPTKSAPVTIAASTEASIIASNDNLSESVTSIENSSVYDSAKSSETSENDNSKIDDISSNEEQLLKALTDFNKCKPSN